MTDKRSESERVSGRPPLPSIAPPTDDIDSEWGTDEIPAPALVPQLNATQVPAQRSSIPASAASGATPLPAARSSAPPRPASSPSAAPRPASSPSAAPRPASSAPSLARASVPTPSQATATPVVSNPLATATLITNPLRKQTLLGIAPVIPQRSEPPTASASSPPAAPSAPPLAPATLPAASSSPARADHPLKQTLLGIAPVLPSPPAEAPAAPTVSTDAAPAVAALEKESSLPNIATAVASAESDAPLTRSGTPAPLPRVVDRVSDTDLPPLRTQRPRWVPPLAVAAVVGLGVVGLRRLDHATVPASLPPAAEAPKAAAPRPPQDISPTPAAAASALPATDDDGNTDSPTPPTAAPEPEPLKAKPVEPAPATSATTAGVTGDTGPVGNLRHIRITSDPPGARMFWRGKEVGTTPFTLKLQSGEKHFYELGLPGYVTRKVVIDGSKSEMSIGMKPESGATPGARP